MKAGDHCLLCHHQKAHLRFRLNGFDIYECAHCSLYFTDILPFQDLTAIYDESYFQGGQADGYFNYVDSEKIIRKTFKRIAKKIFNLTQSKSSLRLLEIGSAYGFFLEEARGYFDCIGIEVSEAGVKHCRERGLAVMESEYNLSAAAQIGNHDITVMLDVIEHLPNPKETLLLLHQHTRTGGILWIETGDIGSLPARLFGKKWRLLTPPQHTFFFSKKTLTQLLTACGWEVLSVQRSWKLVPLTLLFYQIKRITHLPIPLPSFLEGVGIPIYTGDTIRVIARKKD